MAGLGHFSGSRLNGTAHKTQIFKLLYSAFGNSQGSLNAWIQGLIHSTDFYWVLLCARPGGRHFTNFFLFNAHNCGASINSDYSDEIKLLSGFHSLTTLFKKWHSQWDKCYCCCQILQARKGLGSVPCACMCVCREMAFSLPFSARMCLLLQPRAVPLSLAASIQS